MPPQTSRSQALLRIFSLLMATILFIAVAEQDARHESHQRWLAETRRRQEAHLLAGREHSHRSAIAGAMHHGRHTGPTVR